MIPRDEPEWERFWSAPARVSVLTHFNILTFYAPRTRRARGCPSPRRVPPTHNPTRARVRGGRARTTTSKPIASRPQPAHTTTRTRPDRHTTGGCPPLCYLPARQRTPRATPARSILQAADMHHSQSHTTAFSSPPNQLRLSEAALARQRCILGSQEREGRSWSHGWGRRVS